MKLLKISEGFSVIGEDREITAIVSDSRMVQKDCLFVAIPGTKTDGRIYIKAAIAKGATAILLPSDTDTTQIPDSIAIIKCADIRVALSQIAARFYAGQPSTIAAITGTSGKTSTADFTRQLWERLKYKSASLGTLGLKIGETTEYGALTTADPITLHTILQKCAGVGITHLAMEASSHGLDMHRLDNVGVRVGVFTNLSRDHLDYHKDMNDYFAAKLLLFTRVMKRGGTAILNADDARFGELKTACDAHGHKIIDFGRNAKDLKIIDISPAPQGQNLTFKFKDKIYEVFLNLTGSFQSYNVLAAIGVMLAGGLEIESIVKDLKEGEPLKGVPGRMQFIGRKDYGAVYVDYAHKPDALETILTSIKPHIEQHIHPDAKLGVVFGCGGNRDKGKRPIMGEIASRLADWVIITDDNPRNEDASIIRQEVLAGCQNNNVTVIGDRSTAIKTAIEKMGDHDILIIAGKGHETGQIIGNETREFNDEDEIRKVIKS